MGVSLRHYLLRCPRWHSILLMENHSSGPGTVRVVHHDVHGGHASRLSRRYRACGCEGITEKGHKRAGGFVRSWEKEKAVSPCNCPGSTPTWADCEGKNIYI